MQRIVTLVGRRGPLARSLKEGCLTGIRIYQRVLSPLFPPSCRFYPTCSEYSIQAIQRYGMIKGIVLSLKRIGRCHPFSPGGPDPLP